MYCIPTFGPPCIKFKIGLQFEVPAHQVLKEIFNNKEIFMKKTPLFSVEVKTSTMWTYIPREKQRLKINHI